MKKIILVTSWLSATLATLVISIWAFSLLENIGQTKRTGFQQSQVLGIATEKSPQLATYAAIPDVVTELTTAAKTKDARPVVIENYLKKYNSPMVGQGQFIVSKADELGKQHASIDSTYLAYLTVAIAQQESNLGKVMPPNCYNPFGFGIHSEGTLCFASWEEGITRMMTELVQKYMVSWKLQTPEQIMSRYTPNSPNGKWAKGVNQFLGDLGDNQ